MNLVYFYGIVCIKMVPKGQIILMLEDIILLRENLQMKNVVYSIY